MGHDEHRNLSTFSHPLVTSLFSFDGNEILIKNLFNIPNPGQNVFLESLIVKLMSKKDKNSPYLSNHGCEVIPG